MNLEKQIKQLRLSKKLSQKELSEKLGIPSNTYNGYEIGRREPNFETLIKIARYFNVTTDYLLGIEDSKELSIKEVTLEDEVKALKIVRDNVKVAKNEYDKSDLSLLSYYAGKVDALKEVLEQLVDRL